MIIRLNYTQLLDLLREALNEIVTSDEDLKNVLMTLARLVTTVFGGELVTVSIADRYEPYIEIETPGNDFYLDNGKVVDDEETFGDDELDDKIVRIRNHNEDIDILDELIDRYEEEQEQGNV